MMLKHTHWVFSPFFLFVSILVLVDAADTALVFYAPDDNGQQREIYVMNDDGSHVRQLTNTPLWETMPRWSPDGSRIVFERDVRSETGQQFDIFVMDADGSNERRLTNYPRNDTFPTWSPDGQHIAFSSHRDGNRDIYIMEVESGNTTKLTQNKDFTAYSSKPDWAPDGQHIVHEHVIGGGGRHIYITDIEGKDTRPFLKGKQPHFVGNTVISKYKPRWSPDGEHVMYFEVHLRFEPARTLRLANLLIVVDKHGRTPQQLKIPEDWRVDGACWAANGKQILFSALSNGLRRDIQGQVPLDIYRYTISSGKITQITDTPNHKDSATDWKSHSLSVSPAGKLITQWGHLK